MIEPFKYLVQPIALDRDQASGRAVREVPGETFTVYSAAAAAEAVAEFELRLLALNQEVEPMTVTEKTVAVITCDNPACPGTSPLKKNEREGWTFVSSEVYGQPPSQHVYCSPGCVESLGATLAAEAAASPEATPRV